jgi:Ca2+-binding EF-hand superfamily protein
MDVNGDGKLSIEELTDILMQNGAIALDKKEVINIIKQADKDNDGEIDYQELFDLINLYED